MARAGHHHLPSPSFLPLLCRKRTRTRTRPGGGGGGVVGDFRSMWEFKPRPKSMALFGLRVPRGNKNWFAHSFVSIEKVGHAHPPIAQLSLTCFSCHFYLSSQGNQFTMCLFVSSLLPAMGGHHGPGLRTQSFGYYDTPACQPVSHSPHLLLTFFGNFQTFLLICMFYKLFI